MAKFLTFMLCGLLVFWGGIIALWHVFTHSYDGASFALTIVGILAFCILSHDARRRRTTRR